MCAKVRKKSKDSFVYKILISLHLDIFRQKTGHNRLNHIYLNWIHLMECPDNFYNYPCRMS
jgi:hypothetical protein